MTDVDPTTLVAAMTAAGLTLAGRGRGYIRFGWPDQEPPHGALVVLTDGTAPEFPEMMNAVLLDLKEAVGRGDMARRVLESVNPNEQETP